MTARPMWMIRAGRSAAWAEDFLDEGVVAIGYDEAARSRWARAARP